MPSFRRTPLLPHKYISTSSVIPEVRKYPGHPTSKSCVAKVYCDLSRNGRCDTTPLSTIRETSHFVNYHQSDQTVRPREPTGAKRFSKTPDAAHPRSLVFPVFLFLRRHKLTILDSGPCFCSLSRRYSSNTPFKNLLHVWLVLVFRGPSIFPT